MGARRQERQVPAAERGVPYAMDMAGRIVQPAQVPKSGSYVCLVCGQPVSLRAGEVYRPYFAHAPTTTCRATGESVLHAAFKALLMQQLQRERRFTLELRCPACKERSVTTYVLPETDEVTAEQPILQFRADVAVVRDQRVVMVFEVYVSHAVDLQKAAALEAAGVPWVELEADLSEHMELPVLQVVASNWLRWCPCRQCGCTTVIPSKQRAAMERVQHQLEEKEAARRAKEAYWRSVEQLRQVTQRRAEASQRAQGRYRAVGAQRPIYWLTKRCPEYEAFERPLYVVVQGRTTFAGTSGVVVEQTGVGDWAGAGSVGDAE